MEKIKFKNRYSFFAKFDLVNGPFSFETSPLTSELDIAKENGSKVLGEAVDIEHQLEELIQTYLFSVSYDEKGSFFNNEILSASFFAFASKKQVVLSITKNLDLLSGEKFSDFQKYLSKIISYRNAFVHGQLVGVNNDNSVILKFYSGEPKESKLTDEYWSELINNFQKVTDLITVVKTELNNKLKDLSKKEKPSL